MRILVITHVESEGPGTLGTFLESAGASLETVRLHNGDRLPEDLEGIAAIISMGGPMNVYEEDKYPFLREETALLKRAIEADKPVLGVCLGAQMIAKASAAKVTRSPKEEIGWGHVFITPEGRKDVLFEGAPDKLEVFQWHGDMFHIPERGVMLAEGHDCPHQAFRYRNAFGLQFHVEVDDGILATWFADDPQKQKILDRYAEAKEELWKNAERMYKNFIKLIG